MLGHQCSGISAREWKSVPADSLGQCSGWQRPGAHVLGGELQQGCSLVSRASQTPLDTTWARLPVQLFCPERLGGTKRRQPREGEHVTSLAMCPRRVLVWKRPGMLSHACFREVTGSKVSLAGAEGEPSTQAHALSFQDHSPGALLRSTLREHSRGLLCPVPPRI